MKTRKIGILTSGGDCAGLNAVISSIVKTGLPLGYEFIGFEKGWEGILSPVMYRQLDREAIRGISHLGGTILRTTNKGRFGAKVGEGESKAIPDEILREARANLEKLGVEGLIVIGGDGTLSGGLQLGKVGVNIVGVPKTIDNDIQSTDKTFGFSTAVQIATDAIDKIHTTASSHERIIFVECMGRNAGWIALYAGLAGGADGILLPEFSFELPKFVSFLRNRGRNNHGSGIVVVAEGVKLGAKIGGRTLSEKQEILYGGVSSILMNEVEYLAPDEFEMRNVVLGHTQRGGTPNSQDRILSKRYGVAAMNAYHEGKFNHMVAVQGTSVTTVPIAEAVDTLKRVTPGSYEYQMAKTLGIFID